MEKLVLELKNVSTGVVKDVNMEVERGAFFVLLGPSGIGKTNLLNLICGNISPASGTVLINGDDLNRIPEYRTWRAANIGFIYEEENLIPTLTAIENVEIPMWASKVNKAKRREKATNALKRVGMEEKSAYFPKGLSIDEQQKVALARAMAIEPSLVLADEPTGRLDPDKTERLIELMGDVNREKGYTFIVASHDSRFKSRATKVLELAP
jgi:acetoin utilization transport system ATP-binding protein